MGNRTYDCPNTEVVLAWFCDIEQIVATLTSVALCQDPGCCIWTLGNRPMVLGDVTHHMRQCGVILCLAKPHSAAQCCLACFIDYCTLIAIGLHCLVPHS